MKGNAHAMLAATVVHDAFHHYRVSFAEITRRARVHFEQRDWHGGHADAAARLALYRDRVDATLPLVRDALGERATDVATWKDVNWLYSALIAEREDCEIAESFYNSIARRIFSTVGVNAQVEYVFPDADPGEWPGQEPVFRCHEARGGLAATIRLRSSPPTTAAVAVRTCSVSHSGLGRSGVDSSGGRPGRPGADNGTRTACRETARSAGSSRATSPDRVGCVRPSR